MSFFKFVNAMRMREFECALPLRLSLHCVNAYSLRSSSAPVLDIPNESGKFQDSAASIFNKLPSEIRNINNYRTFCRCIKKTFQKQ